MSSAPPSDRPDAPSFPFGLFGASASAPNAFSQGLTGGVDFMKRLFNQAPGSSAVPGFLLPTVDLDELDKRIADLRAAESWLEVNLNMLRATIQGLAVQRNTIAAIHSLGAMGASSRPSANAPSSASSIGSGALPPGWPAPPPMPAAADADAAVTPDPARETEPAAPAPAVAPEAASTPTATAMAGLAANHWMSFLQDQFAKVAQAAVAGSPRAKTSASTTRPVTEAARKAAPRRKGKAVAKRSRSVTRPRMPD